MKEEDNKRGYFRIDDEVYLRVKKVEPSDSTDLHTYFDNFRQSTILTARFHQQRTALAPVLAEIKSRDIAVASYVSMLSDQVDLLATRLLTGSIFLSNEPLQTVNMSAEGMRFHSAIEYRVGDQLEMIYALFPGGDYIPVLAEVLRSEWDNDAEDYMISVEYVSMNDDDKELVIHHMLYMQRQYLQKKRLTG